MAEFDEDKLKALLANEITSAEKYVREELEDDRERAINYFNGVMPDTPRMQGRSGLVSRDTSDIVGWVLPGVMRVFTASDRIVDYEPENENDEAFTDQASDYVNHVFWKQNCGYQIMWNATHDALLQKDGIVKQYWDVSEDCSYSVHTNLTLEQVTLLTQEDGVEVVAQSEGDMAEMETPEGVMPVQTYNLKIKRTTKKGRLVYETVEPENFLRNADAIDFDKCRFQAHLNPNLTRSDLIEMGFDREIVEGLPRYSVSDWATEKLARDGDNAFSGYDLSDKSMDRIDLYECYIKVDVNDDGIAETIRAYYAGAGGSGELLDWEEWDDDTPFDKIPCTPVPHRWDSDSLADEVMDIQQIKTVIVRQMLDNLYGVNMPTPVVKGNVKNPDDLINPGLGVPIFLDENATLDWNVMPFIGDKAMSALQYLDSSMEMRTGVSRGTMALDPETLQGQTATASNNQRDSAYSQIELIARNQAELGWKRVFQKSLRLIVKNQDQATTIRLRDKWVEMDPRFWNANMDATINVGLGTGSRDRDMAMLNNIAQSQVAITDRLAASGFSDKALDMMPKVIKTFVKIAEAAGIKNPESFYPEVDEQTLEQMKQQAAEMQAQGDPKVQAEKEKAAGEMQIKQQELQFKAVEAEQTLVLRREQLQAEMQLKREQLQAELQLKREQMFAEMQLKREMGAVDAYNKTKTAMSTSAVRMGGEPG